MKRFFVFSLVFSLVTVAGAEQAKAPAIGISDYIQGLSRLESAAAQLADSPADRARRAGELADSLPSAWMVSGEGQQFEISTGAVKNGLRQLAKSEKTGAAQGLRTLLAGMRADAEAFQSATPGDASGERARLSEILARREFRNVRGRSWWDRLRDRMRLIFLRALVRLFGSDAIPIVGKTLVWVLIGAAVFFAGLWMYRSLRRGARLESIMPEPLPVSAKEWTSWLAEARSAAAKGNWSDAVHLAYWAGISFLEARGMWRPDRARTPREYLRLLPQYSEYRPTLTELTRHFEVIWYGKYGADAAAFEQTVAHLEKLGCH